MSPQEWGDPPRANVGIELLRASTLKEVERVIGRMEDARGRCFFSKVADWDFVTIECRACERTFVVDVRLDRKAVEWVVVKWTQVHVATCFERPPGGGMSWSEGA